VALEFLEDRTLLTAPQTFIVKNLLDSGTDSLRAAVASANADSYTGSAYDTIQFDPSLAGQTISLTTVGDSTNGPSALAITAPVLIDGSTAPGLTIARSSTAPAFRIFTVGVTGKFTLQDLTISGGQDGSSSGGGGLYTSTGPVTLTNVTFTNNSAQKGGALYNAFATLTATNVTFTSNTAAYVGGLDNAGTATLTNVTFTSNSATAQNGGGGGLGNSGTATLTNVTFTHNSAHTGGGL
jgi:hypothetical protein